MSAPHPLASIDLRGVRQNNLRGFDVTIPRGSLTVVTGVSGSGKSSLAFDTLYAEGQRRYVESVSTYAKQFLDRLPRPDVESISGLTPAVSIRQSAPARSARSTVGTATEIHDHLRLLFARLGTVHCVACDHVIRADSPSSITAEAASWAEGTAVTVLARMPLVRGMAWSEMAGHLLGAGYTRIWLAGAVIALEPAPRLPSRATEVHVVIDRFRWDSREPSRLAEACEQAFRRGEGRLELRIGDDGAAHAKSERWECPACATVAVAPEPALFSFNSPLGVCPACRGFGDVLTFTEDRIVPDPGSSLRQGALDPWARSWRAVTWPRLQKFAAKEGIDLDLPWRDLPQVQREAILEGTAEFKGVLPFLRGLQEKSYKAGNRFVIKRYQSARPCTACSGLRLRPEALRVRLAGGSIAELTAQRVSDVAERLATLRLDETQQRIASTPLAEVRNRLDFLLRVGLGYLTLDRLTRTLSGGEAQRIELANALGARLTDTLYVLDEPTVGLHPRDTDRLLEILGDLCGRGNTLVVVEHEPAVIRAAEQIVDLGPGAGRLGGELLYSGPPDGLGRVSGSETGAYLHGERRVGRARIHDAPSGFIEIEGARHHNLRDVSVRVPLGRMTAVTGVSGSGKSSLVEDVLVRAAIRHFEGREDEPVGAHRRISGFEALHRVVRVDQSPIGRTPRSCPVTYMGAFAALREIYARQHAAQARGLKEGAFSFNTAGGRCEHCEGAGWVEVEMYFLADLSVPCEVCGGARFRPEVLEVKVRGRDIRDALAMTVDEAFEHFASEPRFTRLLHVLRRVGLGYLQLGQPANQLSGGEAQRLKIARELAERSGGAALVVLDEPTVGLHWSDVQRLLDVLDDLVRRGDTVVLVEHQLDVIAHSDWVVDLGPEGGERGGRLVVEGPPERVAECAASHTGRYLRPLLADSPSTAAVAPRRRRGGRTG